MMTQENGTIDHPGKIFFEDKVDGRTWEETIDKVPSTMAWVNVEGVAHAVVHIVITGSPERRCITKFGKEGEFLETSIQSPPPHRMR
jgi:hypothetical protein